MHCDTQEQAKTQAHTNANSSGIAWVYYCDTSGNWRAERASWKVGEQGRTWSQRDTIRVEPENVAGMRAALGLLLRLASAQTDGCSDFMQWHQCSAVAVGEILNAARDALGHRAHNARGTNNAE